MLKCQCHAARCDWDLERCRVLKMRCSTLSVMRRMLEGFWECSFTSACCCCPPTALTALRAVTVWRKNSLLKMTTPCFLFIPCHWDLFSVQISFLWFSKLQPLLAPPGSWTSSSCFNALQYGDVLHLQNQRHSGIAPQPASLWRWLLPVHLTLDLGASPFAERKHLDGLFDLPARFAWL